ncbi:MAG: hypothetical protein L0I80_02000 [Brevibacterium sp.]|uniref:hypothetical protein n=1 Tax=Brevibacterium sp. TaxID=1701 RepID=UPI0026494DDC|nr:hypothetical protein [Brevibacterium sp.]MDN5806889.1 hypothetical protein [Brevibacterium sp.]MDN5834133.1 hypothetical protein [Brevibacterium sp.]MDN5877159.1 hypothetical protein [Brevibacterium sp.]MDN5907980.1 hypothetical protein [Brevibacterium sp.]MDN6122633.1 hypothetical protein [Brevibacterium sp.]
MTAGQNQPYVPEHEVNVSDAHTGAVHSRETGSAPKGTSARIDTAFEHSAGIDSMPLADARERQVILRAMAIAYSASQRTALLAGLLLSASGLWWAAIALGLVVAIPDMVAKLYARKRGVDLYWQSGIARKETSVLGLVLSTLVIIAVVGLIAFNAFYGHPLLTWSWHIDFANSEGTAISIFVGAFIGGTTGWILRRRRYRAKLQAKAEQSTNVESE